MKKILILAILLKTLSLQSQIFAPIGANWYYSGGGLTSPPNSEYFHYESVKDTSINGISVIKIIRNFYRYTGDTTSLSPLFIYNSGDTVYLYNVDINDFGILYIFNANKNDTLILDVPSESYPIDSEQKKYRLVIDSIAEVNYNGQNIKKYKATGLDVMQFSYGGWFMDYAGGLDWFLPRGLMIPEADGPLRCYNDNNFNVNFTDKVCDYRIINGVDIINSDEINIFPNPFIDELHILPITGKCKYEIFDCIGNLKAKGAEEIIETTSFNKGIFIIKIQLYNNTLIVRKLIKE